MTAIVTYTDPIGEGLANMSSREATDAEARAEVQRAADHALGGQYVTAVLSTGATIDSREVTE